LSGPVASDDPNAPGSSKTRVRTVNAGPDASVPFATPALLLASAGDERFAIPVILSLGALAFAFALSGFARRRTRSLLRSTRRLLRQSAGYPKGDK
jgi:hypothetical protein